MSACLKCNGLKESIILMSREIIDTHRLLSRKLCISIEDLQNI